MTFTQITLARCFYMEFQMSKYEILFCLLVWRSLSVHSQSMYFAFGNDTLIKPPQAIDIWKHLRIHTKSGLHYITWNPKMSQWCHVRVMGSQITGNSIVYSTTCPGWQQKYRSSSSSVWWIPFPSEGWFEKHFHFIAIIAKKGTNGRSSVENIRIRRWRNVSGFIKNSSQIQPSIHRTVWTSYQIRKIAGCACAGDAGNVFPATDFKGDR